MLVENAKEVSARGEALFREVNHCFFSQEKGGS